MTKKNFTETPLIFDLHQLKLAFQTAHPGLRAHFEAVYGHLPPSAEEAYDLLVDWQLHRGQAAPPPPDEPVISTDAFVSYYGTTDNVTIRLPKYGLITVDLAGNRVTGVVTPNCLEVYGAFEDVLLISLAPLYRRRGWFPLHAFAALAPNGRVALISGPMGSGKTTTGLTLLSAGWKLLSNDSPLLKMNQHNRIEVLAYPGRLSAYDDSLARFTDLKKFISSDSSPVQDGSTSPAERQKRVFRAEEAFPDPWAQLGPAGGLFFPQIVPDLEQSELIKLAPKEAVLELIPQAIEGWDKPLIGPTLTLLNRLVAQVSCYRLRLSPHVAQLPEVIATGLAAEGMGHDL